MNKTRLNHAKVNAILSDREIDFNLPGGITQTPARIGYDGKQGLSDFNKFYVTNAVKAYLGMQNEFDTERNKSKDKLNDVVIDTLMHYDLLIEVDPFYDLFLKSIEAKNELGEEKYASNDGVYLAVEAKNLLDIEIEKNKVDNGKPMSSIIATIKADLKKVGESNNISYQDLITELNHQTNY
jgi:hypothetical protein